MVSQRLPADLDAIREHILCDGFSPVAVLVAGSRAIRDSYWHRFSGDYDIVIVDFPRLSAARRYHDLEESSDKLTIALRKSVNIAPLLLPNLNLKGNLFVRKLADQHLMIHGSENIGHLLRRATGLSIRFEPTLFYILETVEPLLTRLDSQRISDFRDPRFCRDVLKSVVGSCEVNLLLRHPQIRLPSSWVQAMALTQELVEEGFVGWRETLQPILRLLSTLTEFVESGYSSATFQKSLCRAALIFSYATIQKARSALNRDGDRASFSLDTSFWGYFQFLVFTVCRKLGIRTPNTLSPQHARTMWMDLFSILCSGARDMPMNTVKLPRQGSGSRIGDHWSVLSPLPPL